MNRSQRTRYTLLILLLFSGLFRTDGAIGGEPEDIEVRVDQRVEAMAIVQYLADRLDAFNSPYRREVERHFSPYEDHEAVQLLREMMNIDTVPKGMHSESCMLAMYLKKDLSGVHELNRQDSSVYSSYYGHDRIREFLGLLPEFMKESDLGAFRKRMSPYYERWEKNMEDFLAEKDRTTPYEELFGIEKKWLLILNPLKEIQSSHATRTTPSFNKDTNCFSYSFREQGIEDSVAFLKSDRKMRDLFWHEGTHLALGEGSFVDFKEELMNYSHQFDSCKEQISKTFGYRKWTRYMDECIAYGASLYLMKKEEPERFPYQKLLMKYNGFAHTDIVLDAFEHYDELPEEKKGSDIAKELYPFILNELEKVEKGDRKLATDLEALKKKAMEIKKEKGSKN